MRPKRPLRDPLVRVSPLGVRFWDVATRTDVGDGLKVSAYLPETPTRRYKAHRTASGRYAFRDLPGLRQFETGNDREPAFWQALPATTLRVEVEDESERFQPFTFPVEQLVRGLFPCPCVFASPLANEFAEQSVPLYSAPARPVPGGTAVIRADLTIGDTPAAWGVLEVLVEGRLAGRGIADEGGRVAVLFPYPKPPPPPGLDRPPPFTSQTWSVQVVVRSAPLPARTIPDLCDAINQPIAQVWANASATDPFAAVELAYGHELILSTHEDGVPSARLSKLLITPAV